MDPVQLLISKVDKVTQNGENHVQIPQKDDERNTEFPRASVPRVQLYLYSLTVISMALNVVLIGLFIARPLRTPEIHLVSRCQGDWIGYRRKCYYFSEAEGNWTQGQSHCSVLNSSLAAIDSEEEKVFMLRYKGTSDHWIGLWRDLDQSWKWTNGTMINEGITVRGGGDCAYLNDGGIGSSSCSTDRKWICSILRPLLT